MADQVPSVVRNVHFVYGDKHFAAIITDADWQGTGEQALVVFPPNESSFTTVAVQDQGISPGTWHFPEYVGPSNSALETVLSQLDHTGLAEALARTSREVRE